MGKNAMFNKMERRKNPFFRLLSLPLIFVARILKRY